MADYEWAQEVDEIVRDIIATVDEHQDLAHATIICASSGTRRPARADAWSSAAPARSPA